MKYKKEKIMKWDILKEKVYFIDGSSLYRDGTWRHNKGHKLTNEEIKFLKNNGWKNLE